MSSGDSSTTQDSSFPKFVEQGDDLICGIEELTLRVFDWVKEKSGLRVTLSLQNGAGPVARERVNLASSISRKKFLNLCPGDQRLLFESVLLHLQDFLRAKMAKPPNEESKSAPSLTEEEQREALNLLRNPALLFNAGRMLEQLGLVGETINALILYLVITSRLLSKIISAAIKAESSAGKSFVLESVVRLFPPESYLSLSGMSKQALIYLNESYAHRMIIVAEAEGLAAATYNIRTLLSENRLVFYTVEKNPVTNQQETRVVEKEGPTGLITTTTSPRLHPENETRLVSLAVNEDSEQTKAVKRGIAAHYQATDKSGPDLKPWVNAQRFLNSVSVTIPYASYLAEKTVDEPLRMRRDFARLLAFIEVSAILHLYQRKTKGGYIEANLADYFYAKTLLKDAFFGSLYGVHPNTQKLMDAIKDLYLETGDRIPTKSLIEHLGWTKSKISRWARPLDDYGWIESEGRGKPKFYVPGREVNGVSVLPSIEEIAGQFPELAKDFTAIHPVSGEVVALVEKESL